MTTSAPSDPRLVSINISVKKGTAKKPVPQAKCRPDHGIEGDAHAGDWHRQISLLGVESVDKMKQAGLDVDSGSFGENLNTTGIDLPNLPIGQRMTIGTTLLEVTQIGKQCHDRCAIYHQAGDCVMPREGIFVVVIKGGLLEPGMRINLIEGQK